MQIEEIEQLLTDLNTDYQITAVPDAKFGEAVTLLYTGDADTTTIEQQCRDLLDGPKRPKHYLHVKELPLTGTGKPARAKARELAKTLMGI